MRARSEIYEHWQTVVGAMIGVAFGPTGIIFFTLGLFVKPLSDAFGWSRAQSSGSAMCLQAGIIVMSPVVGSLADRFGPRRVGLLSMFGLGLGLCGLAAISDRIAVFYAAFVAMAVLASGATPVVWTRAINSTFDRRRGLALGLSLSGTGVIAFLAPKFVGLTIALYGWRTAYLAMAGMIVLVALPLVAIFLRGLEATTPRGRIQPLDGATLGEAMATGWFWRSGLAFFLAAGGLAAPIIHLAPMLQDAGVAAARVGEIAGLLGVAMIVGRLTLGALVDRYSAAYVGMAFLLLSSLGSLLLILGEAASGVILIGLATGAEVDLLAYIVSRRFGLRHYGSIYGWQLSMSLIGVGTAAILMGAAQDHWGSYEIGLQVNVIVSLIGALGIGTLYGADRPASGAMASH